MRVVAAVIPGESEDEVLAFRRAPHVRHAGCWEFPGGKVEAGEADEVALAREIFEELSVRIVVCERLAGGPIESTPEGARDFEIYFYRCEVVGGEVALSDHDQVRSVAVGDAHGLRWAPGDVAFVAWLAGDGERNGL